MQNAPVAVAQASQRSCVACKQGLEDFSVCSSCGAPQPVSPDEDYFQAFGILRRFGVHRDELEKKFYQLSRALHPDRFSAASVEIRKNSLDRMSFLNQAYSVLKKPENLRSYLLDLEKVSKVHQPPQEWAEKWFDLQELLMDNPVEGKRLLQEFETEIQSFKRNLETQLLKLEEEYDQQLQKTLLEKIGTLIHQQTYLKSLEKDVERIKRNAH